ncbi:nucleotidyltransferase domain-containing protein [Streptomyces sp. SLBN-8D4]|uniref:nucleotidyltransferase domain-containing protein n=1 Tax=Streptomyces sp. SLBN-8D4 TaxID=3377728 RepID=UPI003C7A481F
MTGTVGGRAVRCLSAGQQVCFHHGYESSPRSATGRTKRGAPGPVRTRGRRTAPW